jgi:hypothetical protein
VAEATPHVTGKKRSSCSCGGPNRRKALRSRGRGHVTPPPTTALLLYKLLHLCFLRQDEHALSHVSFTRFHVLLRRHGDSERQQQTLAMAVVARQVRRHRRLRGIQDPPLRQAARRPPRDVVVRDASPPPVLVSDDVLRAGLRRRALQPASPSERSPFRNKNVAHDILDVGVSDSTSTTSAAKETTTEEGWWSTGVGG